MADKSIEIKHNNGSEWITLYPKTKSENVVSTDGQTVDSKISSLETNKVDKVTGKGLSTNDFSDTDKNKLDSLQDYSSEISNLETNKADKTNVYSKSEVDNIVSSSTENVVVSPTEPNNSTMWFKEV